MDGLYEIDFIIYYYFKTAYGNKEYYFTRKLYADDFIQSVTQQDILDFKQGKIKNYHWPAYDHLLKKIDKMAQIFIKGAKLPAYNLELFIHTEFDYDCEDFSLSYVYSQDVLNYIKGLVPQKLGYDNPL